MSWSSKKPNSVALSTAEVEYISSSSCCAQLLWMKATLNEFGIKFKQVPLLCDNESAMKLTNNPVQHSRTKHIDVYHHFKRDHQQKRGHLDWECGHRWSTCWYIHQATWWEEVLQAKEWIEHIWLLKYVLMHPHYMTCLSFNQSKVSWLTCHSSIAKDLFSAYSHYYHVLGSFMKIKWVWCLCGTTIASMIEII